MRLGVSPYTLKLKNEFRISGSTFSKIPCLVIALSYKGKTGYGEANETGFSSKIQFQLDQTRHLIANHDFLTPDQFWNYLDDKLSLNPALRCALDVAAYDLWGKIHNQPVHQLLKSDISNCPGSSFSIGFDQVDKMVQKVLEASYWPSFKVKLGLGNDIQILKQLRKHTSKPFKVDVNGGWSTAEAISKLPQLNSLGVELIEQPLPVSCGNDMDMLFSISTLPLYADESCSSMKGIDLCHKNFHGVNIKPMKCGGLTPALQMISRARKLNMHVMLGCLLESTVGISAIAQIAPLADHLDLDSATLLRHDIASGVVVNNGKVEFPQLPGIGVELYSEF